MSGGRFDYQQYKITEIADSIEHELKIQGKQKPKEELFSCREYYEQYPEDKFYFTHSKEVEKRMREAVKILRTAAIYAHRIDYYLSGDDGEENFIKRLDSELKELLTKKS